MKINGPNQTNLNPYQKQINKQTEMGTKKQQKDKIEISETAKQMQESGKSNSVRQKLVEQVKTDIESGNYQVDSKATAKKMLDFWSNKS
ncbi:anti-sigma-28 factor, FlgM family [Halobacillus dabanensis]|uniref:Negative regulator of flagellin synthesis n=1 Tax=Halobacillus dabanensis TaxID=240302 RepID=A0A1I3RKI9_HALDA|nr:flagellar biosynthesis anti-sigma factor FlgM [Halobacillus dabanensis]SFJ45797.1 anti-sigma-28 factor, FlgM family [Halobacillus dabanensis]